MHFDEVYHARTATEFLQSWRYGLSHDIYEYTHPHLAKYAMAAGLVAFGNDKVTATSDLDVPVVAAVVEPRRLDELVPGGRAGERLHIATGTELRTYDLVTRDLLSTIPAVGARSLTIDETGNQLVIGYDDGRIATLGLDQIDAPDGGVVEPIELVTVDHPVEHLLVTSDGTSLAAASTDRLTTIDLDGATVLGSIELSGIADLAPGGSGPALTAVVDAETVPATLAASLADILGTDADDYVARLTGVTPGTTVVLGEPGSGQARTDLDKAIADGSLPGVAVDTVQRIAVATDTAVEFIVPDGAALLSTIPAEGGAHGLALVTGVDGTKLYATVGGPRRHDGEPTDPATSRSWSVATTRRIGSSIGESTHSPGRASKSCTTPPARWSTSSVSPRTSTPCRGGLPSGRRDRLCRRTARQRGLRRCASP